MNNYSAPLLKSTLSKLAYSLSFKMLLYFCLIVFVTLLATAGEILTLSTVQPIIQNLTNDGNTDGSIIVKLFPSLFLSKVGLLVFALFSIALATICRLLLIWMNIDFTNKVSQQLSDLMMRSILSNNIQFFKDHSSDQILSAISLKISNASSSVLAVTNLITSSIIILGIAVTVITINTSVTIPAVAIMLFFYAVVLFFFRRIMHSNGIVIATMQSRLIAIAQSAIGSIRDVILNKRSDPFVTSYSRDLKRLNKASAVNTFLNQSPRYAFEALFMACILIVSIRYQGASSGSDFIGIIAVLALAAQRLIPLMQQAYSATANLYAANQAIMDVFSFIDFERLKKPNSISVDKDKIQNITLKNITFSYNDDQPLLQNISFNVTKGDFFVIMGPTGSGKSSLLDIIFGLIKPFSGSVIINHEKNSDLEDNYFIGKVGFVAQKIFVLNSSIKTNIAFNTKEDEVDEERMIECCKDAMLFDDKDTAFLDRQCGENGNRLSGGQIQRLALARVLYQNPDVLVLDEFGSGLDKKTLKNVIENLKSKYRSKIIIYVTHSDLVVKYATDSFIFQVKNFDEPN